MTIITHWKKTFQAIGKLWKKFAVLYIVLFVGRVIFTFIFTPVATAPATFTLPLLQKEQIMQNILLYTTLFLFIFFVLLPLITLLFSLFPLSLFTIIVKNRDKKTTLLADLTQTAPTIMALVTTWFVASVFIVAGSILFVLPGIVALVLFSLFPFVVIYRKKSGFEALRISKNLVWKNFGKLILHAIVFAILTALIITMLWFVGKSFAASYLWLIMKMVFVLTATIAIVYFTLLYEDLEK